ncbi:hypothetical protein ACIRJS_16225 [Streptomyces sp. NPDC102340]|uniref:hypothetical protein n=1 Tax=unclassified Streptomyces TaxID=2593676 RepID=UPI00382FA0B9
MFKSGVGFLALFGLGWWLLATSTFGSSARLIAMVAGCAAAIGLMLAARRLLPASAGAPFPAALRRRFLQVNGIQWLLILAVAQVCARTGTAGLIPPLVAVIVGLHFLPLAAMFEQPRLHVPAVLLTAAGVAGVAVWLLNGPDPVVRLVVGLVSALSLWGMAVWTVTEAASSAAVHVVRE